MAIGRLLQQVLTGVMSPFRPHHHRTVKSRERIRLNLNVRQFDTRMLHVLLAAEFPPPIPPLLSVCAVAHNRCLFNVCSPPVPLSPLTCLSKIRRLARAGVFSRCLHFNLPYSFGHALTHTRLPRFLTVLNHAIQMCSRAISCGMSAD